METEDEEVVRDKRKKLPSRDDPDFVPDYGAGGAKVGTTKGENYGLSCIESLVSEELPEGVEVTKTTQKAKLDEYQTKCGKYLFDTRINNRLSR